MFAPSYNLTIPEEYLDNRNPEDFIALRIVGDNAYPLYHDGDVLLIDTVTEPRSGGPVVVYHGAALQLGSLQGSRFQPLEPCLPPVDDFRIVGAPVLLIREFE